MRTRSAAVPGSSAVTTSRVAAGETSRRATIAAAGSPVRLRRVKPVSGAIPDGSDSTGSRVAARSTARRVSAAHGSGLALAAPAGLVAVAAPDGPGEGPGEPGRDWSTSPAEIAMAAPGAPVPPGWRRPPSPAWPSSRPWPGRIAGVTHDPLKSAAAARLRCADDPGAAGSRPDRALVAVVPANPVSGPIRRLDDLEDLAFAGGLPDPLGLDDDAISGLAGHLPPSRCSTNSASDGRCRVTVSRLATDRARDDGHDRGSLSGWTIRWQGGRCPRKPPGERGGRDRGLGEGEASPVTGDADGATARNLSGTRDRAGMGTLESVADGNDPAERAPTEEPAVADAPRGRSQAPGQRGTEEVLSPMSDPFTEPGFVDRHNGPDEADVAEMLRTIGRASLDDLIRATVPSALLRDRGSALDLGAPRSEAQVLADLRAMAGANTPLRSMIGMGYHDTITPSVIQRNILENPAWYTAYTPYQPEIAQGRLEALINFQTAIADLTGMEIANASLLDEGTAVAEGVSPAPRVSSAAVGNLVPVG